MISLLITSRIDDNPNWGLPNLLQSLVDYSTDYDNFEVLVKFDTCDSKVAGYVPQLKKYPFAVKHIVEPRGRGYTDIHIGYTRAMRLADDRSFLMGAFADDFVVTQPNWDTTVLAETGHFDDDIYMIHPIKSAHAFYSFSVSKEVVSNASTHSFLNYLHR